MKPITAFAAATAFVLTGCSDPSAPPSGLERLTSAARALTPADAEIVMRGLNNPRGLAFRQVGLDLSSEAAAYAALVDVASVQRPGIRRVAPGDPDGSYLVHKLEGRSSISGVLGILLPATRSRRSSASLYVNA